MAYPAALITVECRIGLALSQLGTQVRTTVTVTPTLRVVFTHESEATMLSDIPDKLVVQPGEIGVLELPAVDQDRLTTQTGGLIPEGEYLLELRVLEERFEGSKVVATRRYAKFLAPTLADVGDGIDVDGVPTTAGEPGSNLPEWIQTVADAREARDEAEFAAGSVTALAVGDTLTLPPETPADVVLAGAPGAPVLNFKIPEGKRGLPGVNAVPADEAVAAYVGGPSATHTAVATAIGAAFTARLSFNVKDFGALGDGTTDDGPSITAALTAAAGHTLIFPVGTYATSIRHVVAADTWIVGESAVLIQLPGSNTTGQIFQIPFNADRVKIRGFIFPDGGLTNYLGVETCRIHTLASYGTFEDNVFSDSANMRYGVMIKSASAIGNVVQNSRFYGVGIMAAYGGSKHSLVQGNYIVDSEQNGITSSGNITTQFNMYNIIKDNVIINSKRMGIEDQGRTRSNIITGNTIIAPQHMGISAVGEGDKVEGNTITDTAHYAIEVTPAGAIVRGNSVRYTSETPTTNNNAIGVQVVPSPTWADFSRHGAVISENVLERCRRGVSTAAGVPSVTVANNVITDWTLRGIDTVLSPHSVISGNQLRQTLPGAATARKGLQPAANSRVISNVLRYESDGLEEAIGLVSNGNNIIFAFNTIDGGGNPAEIAAGGASMSGLIFIGNGLFNGSRMVTTGVSQSMYIDNTGFGNAQGLQSFYNGAAVAKPSGTPAASNNLATVIALANDLRAKLIELNLIAS